MTIARFQRKSTQRTVSHGNDKLLIKVTQKTYMGNFIGYRAWVVTKTAESGFKDRVNDKKYNHINALTADGAIIKAIGWYIKGY